MQVTTGLLCDFAQVRDGLLFVLSGGVTRLYREHLPAPMGICCAVVVTLDQMEMRRPHEFELVVIDQDGQRVAEAGGTFQVDASDLEIGEKQLVPLAVDMRSFAVTQRGAHDVVVYVDGLRSFETTFYVTDASAGQASPGAG